MVYNYAISFAENIIGTGNKLGNNTDDFVDFNDLETS